MSNEQCNTEVKRANVKVIRPHITS